MREQPCEYAAVMALPVAALGICTDGELLQQIVYLPPDTPVKQADDDLAAEVVAQIGVYLQEPTHRFNLPMAQTPTRFQQRVRSALRAIPVGSSLTYGEMATKLNSSARAVGGACRRNPVPLVVPCHRVLARAGIGGFSGQTSGWKIRLKLWLLHHEGHLV